MFLLWNALPSMKCILGADTDILNLGICRRIMWKALAKYLLDGRVGG